MAAELGATISAVKSIGETSYGAEPAANMTQSYTIVVPANNAWNDDGSFAAGLIHITASVDVVFYLATQKWMTDRLHGALPRTAADIQNLLVRNKIHGTFLDE